MGLNQGNSSFLRPSDDLRLHDFPFMHRIHEHCHLLHPVLQTYGEVLRVVAALVGISQDGATDGIIVSHKDGSTLGAVKDIIACFMSLGA